MWLNCLNTLLRDNERMRAVNIVKRLKCESQQSSLAAYREALISFNVSYIAEWQMWDLIESQNS